VAAKTNEKIPNTVQMKTMKEPAIRVVSHLEEVACFQN
jgi:hypothetical protein